MDTTVDLINQGINDLVASDRLSGWLAAENGAPGDLVLINNSFIFRDISTVKADSFIALTLGKDGVPDGKVSIAGGGVRFNSDFKRLSVAATNLPVLTPLDEAVGVQVSNLGHMIFLLIGKVDDTEIMTTALQHEAFSSVVWDPREAEDARIDGDRIVVSRTDDEDAIWQDVEAHYAQTAQEVPGQLREKLAVALDKLQDLAVARVSIPEPGDAVAFGVTDAILAVLGEQRDAYADAVQLHTGGGDQGEAALNDILRIAYNFASDATGFLRLIMSVCDLKPIVLWGTVNEHLALSRAFHALPWSRSKQKPSLAAYRRTVSDARNSAFHNLFPFRKSLIVHLPDSAIGSPELHIFSEYSKKKQNQLVYADKGLVDVLLEFTRARERRLPPIFWIRNLEVMNATIALFVRTNLVVKALAAERET